MALEVRFGSIVGDLTWSLDELHTHTTVGVPDDVTVHDPRTRVVGLETDDGPTWDWILRGSRTEEKNSITSRRVDEVQRWDVSSGEESSFFLTEDREIVAVKMHRVGSDELVLNDPVDPGVSSLVKDDSVRVESA